MFCIEFPDGTILEGEPASFIGIDEMYETTFRFIDTELGALEVDGWNAMGIYMEGPRDA